MEVIPEGYNANVTQRTADGFSFELKNVAKENFVTYLMPRYAYENMPRGSNR